MEAAEVGSGLDDPVSYTRHLGSDGEVGHALAIGTQGITPEISFELVSEAVLTQTDRHGSCAIQKAQRSRALPYFDSFVVPRDWPDWWVERSEATELEELAMVAKAPQVACFGKDRESQDGTDARDLLKTPGVGVLLEMKRRSLLQLIA